MVERNSSSATLFPIEEAYKVHQRRKHSINTIFRLWFLHQAVFRFLLAPNIDNEFQSYLLQFERVASRRKGNGELIIVDKSELMLSHWLRTEIIPNHHCKCLVALYNLTKRQLAKRRRYGLMIFASYLVFDQLWCLTPTSFGFQKCLQVQGNYLFPIK